jgi:hypothetical protein
MASFTVHELKKIEAPADDPAHVVMGWGVLDAEKRPLRLGFTRTLPCDEVAVWDGGNLLERIDLTLGDADEKLARYERY